MALISKLYGVIVSVVYRIRRPPRTTQGVSSAASDVYKRQGKEGKSKRQTEERCEEPKTEGRKVGGRKKQEKDTEKRGNQGEKGRRMVQETERKVAEGDDTCLLYTSPSPRDLSTSRMPSSA
eukprot:TRINITY_DN56069_c0_g1_i1.p4 TRINITY_DN56069_c0_g1~~TRINITY_DN56069_c0_g1_i1.p4  ORF type:complete len:122 (-),score=21.86 TRINITY_DN56069_c0_g1_i1:75-440(-)